MTGEQVVESMDNSWKALSRTYKNHPDDSISTAMNIVARIIGEVKSEMKKSHKAEGQITIEEWIAMLAED